MHRALGGKRRVTLRVLVGAFLLALHAGIARDASAQNTTVAAGVSQESDAPPPPGISAALDSARARRGETLVVSLLTYGPSDIVFEKFGHIALGIRDTVSGRDVAFNWGMFSFSQPHFLWRFLTGDTSYWMEGFDTKAFNADYAGDNRTIRQQRLALTPLERGTLLDFVTWNARPENKFYRYDYYQDNCSTRIRDALDWVLRGRLKPELNVPGPGRSWRSETERISASSLPMYAGIEIALGKNADARLSKWEEAFLPERLAEHFESVVLRGEDGRRYRLVESDTVLFTANRIPMPSEPPEWLMMAALLGLTLAGTIAVLADARGRVTRVLLASLVALWYFVGGVLGTALLLAGTVTWHEPYMGKNTTLLQLHPLLLVASVAVPIALLRHARTRAAFGVSTTIAALSVVGVLLQVVPGLSQRSGVVLAVTVPVHIALAIAVWRLGLHEGQGAQRERA
jgi:hypothetical protein